MLTHWRISTYNVTMCQRDSTGVSAASDADSPESWLGEHGDYLYAFAITRVADTHVAEDLVQETLLAALLSRHRFQTRSSLRTWLTSILLHKLVDHRRRSARRDHAALPANDDWADEGRLEQFADGQFDRKGKWRNLPGRWGRGSADPAHAAEGAEIQRALHDCLEKLPPRSSQAIYLAERGGISLAQISKILGVSATNAGVLLHRAHLALRRCLELTCFRDS